MNDYVILPNQIGSGVIGKVHQIQKINPPHTLLIAKIFEEKGNNEYNNEKKILTILSKSNTEFIIKLKNIDISLDFSGYFPFNSKYLLFDNLQYGNLSKYLNYQQYLPDIPEKFIKLFCYKLLKALRIMHNNGIIHNKIDINNIMLDNEFNPVIIHFSESNLINDNNFQKDFEGLGLTLAKLMTSGKLKKWGYNRKYNIFIIIDNSNRKIEESKFWKGLKNQIPLEFLDFFNSLVKSKKPLNIDDLIKDKWLKGIKENEKEIEKSLKIFFLERNNKILNFDEQYRVVLNNIDINSILKIENNFNDIKSMINDHRYQEYPNEKSYLFSLKIRKIYNEPKGFLFDYIEIIFNLSDDWDKSNFFYYFMYNFQKIIQNMENVKYKIDSDKYLSFNVTFEENIVDNQYDEHEINKSSEYIKNFDEQNIIFDDEDENENLEIKIELVNYIQKNEIDNQKYYLIFNYNQGEICDYYLYLNKIKEKAKSLLKNNIKN